MLLFSRFFSQIVHRSISGENDLKGSVHILSQFPQERDRDLLVAFYVVLRTSQGQNYVMNQDILLQALKELSGKVSARIKKEVYNIRAYHEDEGSPPPFESWMDESQTKWIIIAVSIAVTVAMGIIIALLCR